MIKKNDIYECTVTGMGSDGEGVAKIDGYTMFVPFTAAGDRIKLKILKANKSYGFGKAEKILSPSENRQLPPCAVFGKCGGCTLQHISYDAQLRYKREKVCDALKRLGGLEMRVAPVTPSPQIYGYRNKVSVPFASENKSTKAGFYAPHSHRIVPCGGCVLQETVFADIIEVVKRHMDDCAINAYDEKTRSGNVRHVYIRRAAATKEIMVSVVSAEGYLKCEKELVSSLLSVCVDIKSIIINENKTNSNVILGEKCRVIYGRDYIRDILCGREFLIHHNSFYQINSPLTEKLYSKAAELLDDLRGKTVLDIYCGIGTISLTAAREARKIIGIEYVKEAAENARANARINGAENAEFYAGDAAAVLKKLSSDGLNADTVILDPPRKGCDKALLYTVASLGPEKVLYISCNPATLARDMKILFEYGYSAETAYPFDMFPQTHHVETIVLLQNRNM